MRTLMLTLATFAMTVSVAAAQQPPSDAQSQRQFLQSQLAAAQSRMEFMQAQLAEAARQSANDRAQQTAEVRRQQLEERVVAMQRRLNDLF
jgi:hypothetical protein